MKEGKHEKGEGRIQGMQRGVDWYRGMLRWTCLRGRFEMDMFEMGVFETGGFWMDVFEMDLSRPAVTGVKRGLLLGY